MALTLRYAAASDVGLIRAENEDSGYAGPRLLAVADGMGGAAAGEVASSVAIARLADLDDDPPGADLLGALQRCVDAANTEIREMVDDNAALDGMGTTLTALLWEVGGQGGRLGLAHVGDSRGYLLRDGELHQITHDHTFVQGLVDEGRLSSEEARTHPQRSLITKSLDGRSDLEPDLSLREARSGDRYLLCSDGLPAVVSEDTITEALAIPDPHEAVNHLVELALRGGAPDNVTVVVADVVDEPPADPAPVVVGAAATRKATRARPDSAATRAALASRGDQPDAEEPAPAPARRRQWRRPLALTLAILSVLALAGAGGWAYVRAQYYVGADKGQVVVYRGVSGSVAGLSLHSVHTRSDLPVSALPAFEQEKVVDGIRATSRGDADEIVQRLRDECITAHEATPTPRPSGTSGRAGARATPSPAPAAPPAECGTAAP